jgi:hypothetical protein
VAQGSSAAGHKAGTAAPAGAAFHLADWISFLLYLIMVGCLLILLLTVPFACHLPDFCSFEVEELKAHIDSTLIWSNGRNDDFDLLGREQRP